jgi:hypothetical protein
MSNDNKSNRQSIKQIYDSKSEVCCKRKWVKNI